MPLVACLEAAGLQARLLGEGKHGLEAGLRALEAQVMVQVDSSMFDLLFFATWI